MSKFHIVHIIPDSRLHILNGYNEVIKSLIWGLRCFGHEVSYAINQPRLDARNIVLGANMVYGPVIDALPADSIIYNLEQMSVLSELPPVKEHMRQLSHRFTIWDYSESNSPGWKALNEQCDLRLVPIGYAPILSSIDKAEVQDIDVLIYGGPSENRLKVFTDLCLARLTVLFVFGLYDKARDELIARSKLVLNISHGGASVFSIVRTSYLLANRKAVIADARPGLQVDSDLIGAMKFAELDRFVEACQHYLDDDNARTQLEESGFETFKRRDIRVILGQALAS